MSSSIPPKKTPLLCRGHSRPIPQFSYSQILGDGNFFIVSSCLDGKPMLRNGLTGDWIGTFVGHKGAVWCSRINSSATKVATASADYSAKLWDAIIGAEVCSFAHTKVVKTIDFSNDDSRLVTGGLDKTLRLYDLHKPESDPVIWDSNSDSVKTVLWSNEESILLTLCSDGIIRIWDVRSMDQIRKLEMKSPILNFSLTSDKKLLSAVSNRQAAFWSTSSFENERLINLPSSTVCASVDSGVSPSVLITGGSDNWVRMFNFQDGKELEVLKGHHGPVNHVAFAPDLKTFGSVSEDGTVRLWLTQEMSYGLWEVGADTPNPEVGSESGESPYRRNSLGSRWGPSPSMSPSGQSRHNHNQNSMKTPPRNGNRTQPSS